MSNYVVIESRDPFESVDSLNFLETLRGLAGRGNSVTLFLTQNGVLPLRKGSRFNEHFTQLIRDKIKVYADDFALRERAVDELVEGAESLTVDKLVALMLEPDTKALWH